MSHSRSVEGKIKVLIVENHSFFRKTLRTYLEGMKGFEVVGEAEHSEDVFKLTERLNPHFILMEAYLSENCNSMKICKLLKQRNPTLRIILYSMYDFEIQERNSLEVDGFLVKDTLFDELLPLLKEFFQNQKREIVYD